MSNKEEKIKEYADNIMRTNRPYYVDKYGMNRAKNIAEFDIYYVEEAYEAGWNEAIKSLWTLTKEELPEYEQEVIVLDSDGDVYFCHRSNNENVVTDNDGWCRYTEAPIIAWMPIPSFDEILKANKDVLKRLKDK